MEKIIIIGAENHFGMGAALAQLQAAGHEVEVAAPKNAPKGLDSFAKQLTDETSIMIENLKAETSRLLPVSDGRQRRRERRAAARRK
ncbi:hypothetical protein [Pontibacter mucosus]|uniref:hypothetical protein n=1 Tax=Pontibacter mucosus TaxID=1649266 RepID=UPI000D3D5E83|nr:hypothetical protein [Pontibacter mucosus]